MQYNAVFLQNYMQSALKAHKREELSLEEITFDQGFESRRDKLYETNEVAHSSIAKEESELGLGGWLGLDDEQDG